MSIRLTMVVVCILVACNTYVFADEWVPLRGTELPSSKSSVNIGTEHNGDRAYMAHAGQSLRQISFEQTGSEDNWKAISVYNRMGLSGFVDRNRIVLIPESLLINAQTTTNAQVYELEPNEPVKPLIPSLVEPKESALSSAGKRITGISVEPQLNVPTTNVDLFPGEVSVLGKVSVSRVAVGNGSVIQAEVLKSGELLVIGQAPGSTSLRLWHIGGGQSDFNIRVSEQDNETRFPMERMVRMKVKMVEFRKSALGKLGIEWSESVNGPSFGAVGDVISNNLFRPAAEGFENLPNSVTPFSTYFGIASGITSRINLLASNGDAVTLAEPVLSCTNGGNASFLAGGEIPFSTIGDNGETNVQFKDYGIKLDISPQIDPAGNVRTMIETEISRIDPTVSIQGTPGLLTRKARTQVNVRSGETIVISGLLSKESSTETNQLPLLGDIPVVGQLFKSQNIRDSVTELVIFVTPEVIVPESQRLSNTESQLFNFAKREIESVRKNLSIMD